MNDAIAEVLEEMKRASIKSYGMLSTVSQPELDRWIEVVSTEKAAREKAEGDCRGQAARLAELVEAVKHIEFIPIVNGVDGGVRFLCPSCGSPSSRGHDADCSFATALARFQATNRREMAD